MLDKLRPRRHLDLEGAYNVRDIGGYATRHGQTTRWRTFLRSGSMHRLTTASQAALVDYGVRTVIDLRRTHEVEEMPNVFAGSPHEVYYHQNMIGDDPLAGTDAAVETGEYAEWIVASYSTWLDHRQPQICQTLATLAGPGTPPAVYHCAGGKDRTGIISALLLGIAGVSAETIAEDYALSARYLLDRYFESAPPGVTPSNYTWEDYQRDFCPPEAMLRVLGYLDKSYGGVEDYVRKIGLARTQIDGLREALVE